MREFKGKLAIKCLCYYLAKSLGLFKLAMKYTENENRILCYHGGSISDEHVFLSGMFISQKIFKKQLQIIKKYGFNVLPLDAVVKQLKAKTLPKKSLVITFDDGFYNTMTLEPLLKEFCYPATLYVTTYYVTHQRPNFNVTLWYLFSKTHIKSLSLKLNQSEEIAIETKSASTRKSVIKIIEYAQNLPEEEQDQLLQHISEKLEVDLDIIRSQRLFHNITEEELKALHERQVIDVQLHTHHHVLPKSETGFIQTIEQNRDVLAQILDINPSKLCHFCYPHGTWSKQDFPLLKQLDIKSATTLDNGLNSIDSEPLALKRLLCLEDTPIIIYEAHLTGFRLLLSNLLRNLKQWAHPIKHEQEKKLANNK